MLESRGERARKIADIHYRAREKAGRSQEYMALELGVSKKTVQNWERGISFPDLMQSREWFRILNTNPLPYYLEIISPYKYHNENEEDIRCVDETFQALCEEISTNDKRAILYLYHGYHGSNPFAVLQLLLAYLRLPLKVRVSVASLVSSLFEMENDSSNNNFCKDDILPNIDVINDSVRRARVAVMHKEYGYTVLDKEVAEQVEQVMDVALEKITTDTTEGTE